MSEKSGAALTPGLEPQSCQQSVADGSEESVFSRYVVAPIIFITFILSLAMIDRKTAERIFGKQQASGSGSGSGPANEHYYHSNQRKLSKQGMVEAFEIQRVLVICLVGGSVLAVVLAFTVNRLWQFIFH